MYKIIALMGESGAGKDRMMQEVLVSLQGTPNIHEIISCTSRPMRQGEANGINYYFYTPDQFMNKIYEGEMLEFTNFNNWWYGTSFDSVRSDGVINIGVFNPAGVRSLLERDDCDVIVYWVQARAKDRLIRQLEREEDPNVSEIVRRFMADEEDFSDIDFNYIPLSNYSWDEMSNNVKAIASQIETMLAQGRN